MKISSRCLPFLLCTALGCGHYVAYDEGEPIAPRAGGAPIEPAELETFRHRAFAGLMAAYVSEDPATEYALVDYEAWASDTGSMLELERSAALVASIDPAGLEGRAERVAFWLNVYNMSVVRGALARLAPGFRVIDDAAFFAERAYEVGGVALSLDQIEHGVLRGEESERATGGLEEEALAKVRAWRETLWEDAPDPRLHAAVNCGAIGCPDLLVGAPYVYEGARLEAQLDAQTRAWINDDSKGAGPDGVSMIFTWFEEDFEASGGVRSFIEAHRDEGASPIEYGASIEYDWTLNAL